MAAYAALVSLEHIMNNLQLHHRPPISLHKKQVRLLTQKITFLKKFLEGYNPHLVYSTEADPLESRIADAAYAAEDVIESHIVDQITSDGEDMSSASLYEALEKVIEEMALIEDEAMEIKETMGFHDHHEGKSTPPDSLRSSSSSISMVGADDVLLEMKDKLTSDRLDLQIIPVVGMGGTGKTTLARTIYRERLIKEHFHICLWATISQEYSIKGIFSQVLDQLNNGVGLNLSEDELGEMLYKHLCGRRYLIIMDDMWSIDAWDRVRNFFPDNKNGSRIVITMRLSSLASTLSVSGSLKMELLDDVQSWELLSKTVFGENNCPIEFEEIGKKIGRSCKGLPLSIVVVGGLLAKSKHTTEYWEYVEGNLNSVVNLEDDERCLKILHMSYRQLPIDMKPCFLYMGIFSEDYVIRVSRVVKLWVAEGFLKPVTGKGMEEVARVYLKGLVDRNLIMIHKMGSTGNIKECKVHDLLRDLCLREAEKERFYTIVARPPNHQGLVNGQRRIVISSSTSENEAKTALWITPLARSLIWNLEYTELPPLSFRSLRIFDSCRSRLVSDAEFLDKMDRLVNSRFLAILAESLPSTTTTFFSSVWLFWNLQTLIVDVFDKVTAPTHIWNMPHIMHVQFLNLYLPDPPTGKEGIVLGNLQTLRRIRNFKCSQQVVKRIPNIKKLQIIYFEGLDHDRYCLTNLACLDKLESLYLCCPQEVNPSGRLDSPHSLVNFPHSLKKLSLRLGESQCWEGILDMIGSLPLLQKLKLVGGSFKEGRWETRKGHFRSLKFLAVRWCEDLQFWKIESSHFPCLDHLVLEYLYELEEIPLDFAEMSTLRAIDVERCRDSVVLSAKRISEEQEEFHGEGAALHVQVRLRWKDEALESLAGPNFRVLW